MEGTFSVSEPQKGSYADLPPGKIYHEIEPLEKITIKETPGFLRPYPCTDKKWNSPIQYLMPDKFKTNFKDISKNSFSVLHLNIRSINKNFEAFTEFYSKLNHIFSVICFSETWASEENIDKNSTFQLKNYDVIHQVRNSRKGGGLCIFIHESLCYKLRKKRSINSEAIESLSIEISNKKASNLIFNAIYRPPTGETSYRRHQSI